MSTELGMERNKTPVLMADVVTDSVARPREQLDQPDEHMDIQEAEEVTEIDKIGLCLLLQYRHFFTFHLTLLDKTFNNESKIIIHSSKKKNEII